MHTESKLEKKKPWTDQTSTQNKFVLRRKKCTQKINLKNEHN